MVSIMFKAPLALKPYAPFSGIPLPSSAITSIPLILSEKSNLGGTSPAALRCIRSLAVPALTPGPAVAPTRFSSVCWSGFPKGQQELEGRKDVFISMAFVPITVLATLQALKIFAE